MAIEIVDLPIRNANCPWIFVCLPELVGGLNPSEKYESMGRMTSHILWKIQFMFETSNQT
jgi:hypothetical protein